MNAFDVDGHLVSRIHFYTCFIERRNAHTYSNTHNQQPGTDGLHDDIHPVRHTGRRDDVITGHSDKSYEILPRSSTYKLPAKYIEDFFTTKLLPILVYRRRRASSCVNDAPAPMAEKVVKTKGQR